MGFISWPYTLLITSAILACGAHDMKMPWLVRTPIAVFFWMLCAWTINHFYMLKP